MVDQQVDVVFWHANRIGIDAVCVRGFGVSGELVMSTNRPDATSGLPLLPTYTQLYRFCWPMSPCLRADLGLFGGVVAVAKDVVRPGYARGEMPVTESVLFYH